MEIIKKSILLQLLFCVSVPAFCQFTSYSKYHREYSYVSDVEDMSSYESKMYNRWTSNEADDKAYSLLLLNAARAQDNLIDAPALIVAFNLYNASDDNIDEGLNQILLEIINTSPKKIKSITFKFSFERNGEPVYDVKTGDRYCVLTFGNLVRRTSSERYNDIKSSVLKTYHFLDYRNALFFKPFYNKKVTSTKLESVKVVYTDGTTTKNIAIWDEGYNNEDRLLTEGPLQPIIKFLDETKD